ncbi:MAG: [FeFe] hydrogenase H-cluster maturation GTPase HydF [Bacillota bacterium]|jgi:[FeFe] hydrogenase H-cluster maturation GTPase HydF
MQDTPKGNRLHIALFGRRNAGKSSLINALSKQNTALVSDVPGTTTDPVYKAMEILPLGPVMLIDTAGIDDGGELGKLRVQKTFEVLNKTDLVVLVVSGRPDRENSWEDNLIREIKQRNIPLIGVYNKADLGEEFQKVWSHDLGISLLPVSAATGLGIEELKMKIIKEAPGDFAEAAIVGDLIDQGDLVILVVPIDSAAPKGRLILPQVQVIRDILDGNAISIVVKEHQLAKVFSSLKEKPKIVITDSQVFAQAAAATPHDVLLTSFSILFARYKGDLGELVKGIEGVKQLKPGDKVLIAEACTHHRQADDIGRTKIPNLLCRYVGGELDFSWSSGMTYPPDLSRFKIVVHCGGCMINRREMLYRTALAKEAGVPIVNYGVLLGFMNGILERALLPFRKEISE